MSVWFMHIDDVTKALTKLDKEFSGRDCAAARVAMFRGQPVSLRGSRVNVVVNHEGDIINGIRVCGKYSYAISPKDSALLGMMGGVADDLGISYRDVLRVDGYLLGAKPRECSFCWRDDSMGRDFGKFIERVSLAQLAMSWMGPIIAASEQDMCDESKKEAGSRGCNLRCYATVVKTSIGKETVKQYVLRLVKEGVGGNGVVGGWDAISSAIEDVLPKGAHVPVGPVLDQSCNKWRKEGSIS